MKLAVRFAAAILVLLSSSAARAQSATDGDNGQPATVSDAGVHTFAFTDLPYYEPLRAEPRAARNMILFPAWAKQFPNSVEPGSRFAWQIALGKELPIVALSNQAVKSGNIGSGKWGLGL